MSLMNGIFWFKY